MTFAEVMRVPLERIGGTERALLDQQAQYFFSSAHINVDLTVDQRRDVQVRMVQGGQGEQKTQ